MRLKGTIISLHQLPPLLRGACCSHPAYQRVFQNHSEELFLFNASKMQVTTLRVSNQQSTEAAGSVSLRVKPSLTPGEVIRAC